MLTDPRELSQSGLDAARQALERIAERNRAASQALEANPPVPLEERLERAVHAAAPADLSVVERHLERIADALERLTLAADELLVEMRSK